MTTGYGGKEREFLDALKADTGRDLDEWMQAIAARASASATTSSTGCAGRASCSRKASWLERIHHNGGKPIYGGAVASARAARPPRRRREGCARRPLPHQRVPRPQRRRRARRTVAAGPRPPPARQRPRRPAGQGQGLPSARPILLARSKAVRADAQFSPRDSAVVIARSSEFAMLASAQGAASAPGAW